jgi:hypothetical protein
VAVQHDLQEPVCFCDNVVSFKRWITNRSRSWSLHCIVFGFGPECCSSGSIEFYTENQKGKTDGNRQEEKQRRAEGARWQREGAGKSMGRAEKINEWRKGKE